MFNGQSDYSKENTSDKEEFPSIIFQSFYFEPEQKKACSNESQEKETKYVHASTADLLHNRIENPNCYKCRHCEKEARGKNCPCCREVNGMLTGCLKLRGS